MKKIFIVIGLVVTSMYYMNCSATQSPIYIVNDMAQKYKHLTQRIERLEREVGIDETDGEYERMLKDYKPHELSIRAFCNMTFGTIGTNDVCVFLKSKGY